MSATELLRLHGLESPEAQLAEWLQRQRWFGERAHASVELTIVDAAVLQDGDPTVVMVLVAAVTPAGGTHHYHVPLGVRPVATVAGSTAIADRTVTEGLRDGDAVAVYDAMIDPACCWVLWTAIAEGRHWSTGRGELRCRPLGLELGHDGADTIHPLVREQSNTSVVRAERELLKCLRRVESGVSPELEMTEALARAGFTHVAAPLGAMEYAPHDGEPVLLVLVQPFLHNGSEGWALALTSLRDLYADAEIAPPRSRAECAAAVEEQGSAFMPEAARLGEVTADMHLALAGEGLPKEMRPQPVDTALLGRWADEMTAELDRLLSSGGAELDPLRARRARLAHGYDALRSLGEGGLAIRVHGDYHLGQVLRTDEGWTVLDFEGEPARPAAERRRRSSPLRDVAGMMRSFDYAAAAALAERVRPGEPDWESLLPQGEAWATANRQAFWSAYWERSSGSPLLPAGDGALAVRHAFELQKAVYEVGYELGHRPDWVGIPLRFLLGETP